MRKLIFNILSILFVGIVSGQNELLITVENQTDLRLLKSQFNNIEVDLAFPNSRKPLFKKVYSIKYNESKVSDYIFNNQRVFNNPVEVEPFEPLYTPNDLNIAFTNDYALDLINAEAAWAKTKGDTSVVIGISDTNYDLNHEELDGQVNYVSPNLFHSDMNHGTAVAITAAGSTDNNLGKSSIGFDSKLVLYSMNFNDLLEMSYNGVQVINMSWANGCTYNHYYQELIDELYENGTILVAAAGNGNTCNHPPTALVYPAAYDHVISVSSVGPNDNHERTPGNPSTTHQHNEKVDLVAPGYDVALSIAGNNYLTGNGTSFAAPMVSGTIALMLSVNPCLTYEDALDILKTTAVNVDQINPNYAGLLGAGRIDAGAAVLLAEELAEFNYDVESYFDCTYNDFVFEIIPEDSSDVDSVLWNDGNLGWKRIGLEEGSYTFTIYKNNGCEVENEEYYIPNQDIFDYNESVTISSNSMTLHDFNNDGVISIRGNLIIEDGVNANIINRDIAFGPKSKDENDSTAINSGVIIKNNAKLTIKNSKLSGVNSCGDNWNGVRILEYSANETVNLGTPQLFVDNSTIENADTAISNFTSLENGNNYGRVRVLNSNFKNNNVGIALKKGATENYPQTVRNTTFSSDFEGVKHLTGEDITSFYLTNNTFTGINEVEDTLKGMGIVFKNVNLNSKGGEKIVTELNSSNTFNNLYRGLVSINNSQEVTTSAIVAENFNNCINGSVFMGKQNILIEECNFINVEDEVDNNYGLWIENVNYINVFNNSFIGKNSKGYGIVIFDQERITNEFYSNTFTGSFKSSIHSEYVEDLLVINCNSFDNQGKFDISFINSSFEIGRKSSVVTNSFSDCIDVNENIGVDYETAHGIYNGNEYFSPNCFSSELDIYEIQEESDWSQACPEKKGQLPLISDVNTEDNFNYGENFNTNTDEVLSSESYTQPNENKKDNKINIYPNPNNGNFSIESAQNLKGYKIYDTQGRLVLSENKNDFISEVKLNNNAAGSYHIHITDESNQVSVVKFIVN